MALVIVVILCLSKALPNSFMPCIAAIRPCTLLQEEEIFVPNGSIPKILVQCFNLAGVAVKNKIFEKSFTTSSWLIWIDRGEVRTLSNFNLLIKFSTPSLATALGCWRKEPIISMAKASYRVR